MRLIRSGYFVLISFLCFHTLSIAFHGFKRFSRRACRNKWPTASFTSLKLSSNSPASPYTSVFIVPTGVGASIGGFAGDALPSAKLLAGAADILITHPNVMNGAMLYWPVKNILYVEGYALDEFAAGRIGLQPVDNGGHKIGLLLDKGIEESVIVRHMQVADAMRATLGINIAHAVVSREVIGVKTMISEFTGASWGSVEDPSTLLDAANALRDKGCTAIAVIARFPEDQDIDEEASERFNLYRQGLGVDSIAGIEALISHIITKKLMIPVAHAPAFAPSDLDDNVSPKACAEEIGYTFLPCILAYLHLAPYLISLNTEEGVMYRKGSVITQGDVNSVIVPYNALGGPAVLSFLAETKCIVIAVLDNHTSMNVEKSSLPESYQERIVLARSYAEAAGYVMADKLGILRDSISSQVLSLKPEYL